MTMTPPSKVSALLLVKVLLIILNEESFVYMTPLPPALFLVKVLLVILNVDCDVAMTPVPRTVSAKLLVKVLYICNNE